MDTKNKSNKANLAGSAQSARAAMRYMVEHNIEPTPDNYRRSWNQAGGAMVAHKRDAEQSVVLLEQRVDQLTRLSAHLYQSIQVLLDGQRWFEPVLDAVAEALRDPPEAAKLNRATELLRATRSQQERAAKARNESLGGLRETLGQWVDWLRTVDSSTDSFGSKMSAHLLRIDSHQNGADEAGAALKGIVGDILRDSREMHVALRESKTQIKNARQQADAAQAELESLEIELARASLKMLKDPLTGVLNRRGLDQAFNKLTAIAKAEDATLTLSLIDIDDFKAINDTMGHAVGDLALRELAKTAESHVRPGDVFARYGGEEFAVLALGLDANEAAAQINQIQQVLSDNPLEYQDQTVALEFSAGVGVWRDGELIAGLIERADEALYRAKRAGKNCVRIA